MSSIRVLALFVAVSSVFWGARPLQAQANMGFSGGNGTPLTIVIGAPVTYTITNDFGASGNGLAPFFLFQAIGNYNTQYAVTGTVTFSINGGPAQAISVLRAGGLAVNSASPVDWYVLGNRPGVNVGDTVTLSAGSLTTTGVSPNFAAAPPANGGHPSFLFDNSVNRISTISGTPAVRITGIEHFSDGSAKLTLSGTAGATAQVDLSNDLANWSSLGPVNFSTATQTITDPNLTNELRRFYKAHAP